MVNAQRTVSFLRKCREHNINIHTLTVVKNYLPIVRLALRPYERTDRVQLYSLSKPFTSLAFGILCEQGNIGLDDTLLSVFPEYERYVRDDRKKHVTFRNLLTMSSGHGKCHMGELYGEADVLKAYFSFPAERDPGSEFLYSTSATMMVAAAVERLTRQPLNEWLYPRLFRPLGISEIPEWDTVGGICQGGTGLRLCADELERFAALLAGRGSYCGQQIIPRDYFEAATANQLDTAPMHAAHDWKAGYGYQFWQNDGGGFRGDGAYGQLCVVFPGGGNYFVVTAEAGDMQLELDFCRELFYSLEQIPLSDSESEVIASEIYEPVRSAETLRFERTYLSDIYGRVKLRCDNDLFEIMFGDERFAAGNGYYVYSEPMLTDCSVHIFPEAVAGKRRVRARSCFEVCSGVVTATLRSTDTPHTLSMVYDINDDSVITLSTATASIGKGSVIKLDKPISR